MDVTKMPKLGFGLMRLPEKDGAIDMAQVCEMADAYLASGMNYFDTAYVYHGGNSERAVKEVLTKRHPRESFTVASKLPAWSLKCEADRDKIINEQLERTGLEYFDYYLLHSIEDGNNYDTYERLDCFNWGLQKKKEGKIRNFGFSFHGTPELLTKVLDLHPEIEFVQIQLNYADWDNKIVRSGELYEILHARKIPMIIMEPVKGGTLANMAPEFEKMFKDARPDKSVASWALRFVASLPGVVTILSGMSNREQMQDNISTFTDFEPLSDAEKAVIDKVVGKMLSMELVPCTSCRYCTDGCPMGIKIPDIFRALNTLRQFPEDMRPRFFYNGLVSSSGRAGDCIACGQCEGVCPQHLEIIELLKEASALLD
jgi:predicted aldo/keto reductase-like oxidoreductase